MEQVILPSEDERKEIFGVSTAGVTVWGRTIAWWFIILVVVLVWLYCNGYFNRWFGATTLRPMLGPSLRINETELATPSDVRAMFGKF